MSEKIAGKIYPALHKVMGELDVDKDGVLPANMSGSAYRTAEAITSAVRDLFSTHGLIFLPMDRVIESTQEEFKNRMNYSVVIEGTYEIVHIEDGSSVTIRGIGRGVSTGTAVDANVASTFALKNALQRLLLISDNREEEAAMRDGTPGPTKVERAATKARSAAKPAAKKASPVRELQKKVKEQFIDEGMITSEQANEEIKRLKEAGDENPFQTLLNALEKGELPDA